MTSWELSLVFKATVLFAAALGALGVLARMRASRRHLVVAAAFISVMGLPLASLLVPSVEIPLEIAIAPGGLQGGPLPATIFVPGPSLTPSISPASPPSVSPAAALRGLWLLGSASLLLTLVGSLWKLHRLKQSAVPWVAGQTLGAAIARDVGVKRTVTVAIQERVATPATMGVLLPTILLPADAPLWDQTDLRRVLIHELEHVRRGDWWTDTIARTVCILHWFNPVAWIALRQLGVLAERACDDAVIARTDGTDYAEQLVTLARRLSTAPRPVLSMAGRSALSIRVGAILNPHQRRGRAGAAAAACIVGAAAMLAGTVASVEATALRPVRHGGAPSLAVSTSDARNADVASTGAVTSKPESVVDPKPVDRARRPTAPLSQPAVRQALRELQSPAPIPPAANSSAPATYVIGEGDVLYVSVLRQQDLSTEVVVRPDGKISLPLLGDVHAAGLQPDQLRGVVTAALARFVSSPIVTVQVRAVSAAGSVHSVFVIGEVARPGAYPLTGSMTVLQLLATAGGLKEFARRKDGIAIVREVDGKSTTIPFDYAAVTSGQRMEQNVVLLPGDVVIVR